MAIPQVWSREGVQAGYDAVTRPARLHVTRSCRRVPAWNVPTPVARKHYKYTDTTHSMAGADTTAIAIRMTFLHLLSTPHAYLKLYQECMNANVPLDSIVTHSRALSLPYLQACIREGLRIYPVVAALAPKIAPPEGDTLEDGTYIPPGTEVGLASWLIYHNKAIYGADADIYRPERWIEASEEQAGDMKQNLELLFGYGRFKCLGQNVAMMELPKVIFELVRRFEWSVENPLKPLEMNTFYALHLQKGMWLRVRKVEVEVEVDEKE